VGSGKRTGFVDGSRFLRDARRTGPTASRPRSLVVLARRGVRPSQSPSHSRQSMLPMAPTGWASLCTEVGGEISGPTEGDRFGQRGPRCSCGSLERADDPSTACVGLITVGILAVLRFLSDRPAIRSARTSARRCSPDPCDVGRGTARRDRLVALRCQLRGHPRRESVRPGSGDPWCGVEGDCRVRHADPTYRLPPAEVLRRDPCGRVHRALDASRVRRGDGDGRDDERLCLAVDVCEVDCLNGDGERLRHALSDVVLSGRGDGASLCRNA